MPQTTPASSDANGRRRATPLARAVARELGVDLAVVTGSGRGGVINPPEAAILAVGAAQAEPVATVDGGVEVHQVLRLTLSIDHRALDGATGASPSRSSRSPSAPSGTTSGPGWSPPTRTGLPLPRRPLEPDCAAITAAIEASTGTRCEAVTGKPDPAMLHAALAGLERVDPYLFPLDTFVDAEYGNVEQLREALRAHHAVPVAVGSGSLNDLVKRAAYELERPYLNVATAASMDGSPRLGRRSPKRATSRP